MMIVSVGGHYLTRFDWSEADGDRRDVFTNLEDVPARIKDEIVATYRRNGYAGDIKFLCGGAQNEGGKAVHWVRTEPV